MSKKQEVAFAVSTKIVRRGLVKTVEVSITDGVDTWKFDTAESFTVAELKQRFPHFYNVGRPRKQKPTVPKQLPGRLELIEP